MNPLDNPGELFDFACFNVRPSSRKRKGEPFYTLTMEVDEALWMLFQRANTEGAIFAGRLFRSKDGEVEQEAPQPSLKSVDSKHQFGECARVIVAHGTFNAPEVLKAIGSDEEFRSWLSTLPSCLSGEFDYDDKRPEGYTIACHVRRAGESGTGLKPMYSCVPMKDTEHRNQHQHGEAVAIYDTVGTKMTTEEAKEWFTKKAAHYRTEWARRRLAVLLGKASLGDVSPLEIATWVNKHGLGRFFPRAITDLKTTG